MNIDDVSLRDLRYFQAVCEAQHLSWAAEALHVAQPTLSHALSRLERAVGHPLLERPRNKRAALRPTPAGRSVLERARQVLNLAEGLADGLGQDQGAISGPLRVGSIQSLNLTLIPRALASFAVEHPGVDLTLRTFEATAMADGLRRGALDLAVVAGAPAESLTGLLTQQLYREPFIAIVRRDDPLARHDRMPLRRLADRDLVLVPRDSYTGALVHEACARAGFEPRLRLAVASGEALRETVRSGLGITVLPAGYLAAEDSDLRAVELTNPTPSRSVLMAEAAERQRSHAADAFAQVLTTAAKVQGKQ